MTAPSLTAEHSPWLQAGRLAFIALYIVTLLVAVRWGFSNVRQVEPNHSAVIVRMGALSRIQHAGLLWAWPQPFEHVVLLPAAETVIEHHVQTLLRSKDALQAEMSSEDDHDAEPLNDALAGSGYLLTGDSGIVQLDVRVFYRVIAPYEFVLQQAHIGPALNRIVTRTALAVCAARDLDTILVARPEFVGTDHRAAEQRERLRGDLMRGVNAALAQLNRERVGLGIEITRVDVQSKLPSPAVSAFNTVLTSSQMVDRNLAEARNDAAWMIQNAEAASDRLLQVAQAQASERLAKAQADTAAVLQLSQSIREGVDPGLLVRVYRERMNAILAKAGSVTMVDAKDDSRLIIPGAQP
jgi:regulator of protease activity HflC (stomatin/prohibitin superfamily)